MNLIKSAVAFCLLAALLSPAAAETSTVANVRTGYEVKGCAHYTLLPNGRTLRACGNWRWISATFGSQGASDSK